MMSMVAVFNMVQKVPYYSPTPTVLLSDFEFEKKKVTHPPTQSQLDVPSHEIHFSVLIFLQEINIVQ